MQQVDAIMLEMETSLANEPRTRRTGGRSAMVRRAVLQAALDELMEYGVAGLSTARIADRAGVHRTTVHRRWPDLTALITEALLSDTASAVPIPDTGSVRGDLEVLLRAIAALVDSPEGRIRTRTLIADAARSPEIGELVRHIWMTRFALGREVIERGIARGELRRDIPPATILATFIGPLYVRLLITDERIDDAFIQDVIEAGLAGSRATA